MYEYNSGQYYNPQGYYMQQQQNRLNQMEQQFPSYQNRQYGMYGNYNNNMNNQQFLKGRPVSNVEEARSSMIDLDGSLFVFPDVTNKAIYTKQINMDGTASFHTYVRVDENKQENKNSSLAFMDDIPSPDDFKQMKQKISELEGKLNRYDELFAINAVNAYEQHESSAVNKQNGTTKPNDAKGERNGAR